MAKVHIPANPKLLEREEREKRISEQRGYKQPQNSDIMEVLLDIYAELKELRGE